MLQPYGKSIAMEQSIEKATELTREQARVMEQSLMMAFGTIEVFNKINFIASKNWNDPKFAEEVWRLQTLFSIILCID